MAKLNLAVSYHVPIGTAPEPESEHPTIPDSPTHEPLTSTSKVTEPESIPGSVH